MTIPSGRVKLLLDTDIGTDIDDAVCLAYLLLNPRCHLLGITTVAGEADRRAMVASAICRSVGREIPIYPGASDPLSGPQRQKSVPQAERLQRWDHASSFPRGEAIEFFRRTIRRYPGEVILLTIGPLTNAGLLFTLDPEIPSLLKGLVMMCGQFSGSGSRDSVEPEWNAGGDPQATAIAYQSRVRMHRSIGLDVTRRVTMAPGEFQKAFRGSRAFRPVLDFSEVFFREGHAATFHDPLAAATIFDDTLCRFERGTVEVDVAEGMSCGRTLWTPGNGDSPHEVAVDTEPSRFFQHFRCVIGGAE